MSIWEKDLDGFIPGVCGVVLQIFLIIILVYWIKSLHFDGWGALGIGPLILISIFIIGLVGMPFGIAAIKAYDKGCKIAKDNEIDGPSKIGLITGGISLGISLPALFGGFLFLILFL